MCSLAERIYIIRSAIGLNNDLRTHRFQARFTLTGVSLLPTLKIYATYKILYSLQGQDLELSSGIDLLRFEYILMIFTFTLVLFFICIKKGSVINILAFGLLNHFVVFISLYNVQTYLFVMKYKQCTNV